MKRILLLFVLVLLAGCAPNYMQMATETAAVEIDADSNGAIDVSYGGTNSATATDARTALGLGTAATTAATDYATAAQGTLADSALQAADVGTAAAQDVGTAAGNVVQLDGTGKLPAVDGSQLTNIVTTDDQTIDTFTLGGTTLSLSLEGDGQAAQTVDLSPLQDGTGTDDQTAAEVPFTPEGSISATTVQAAIQEVRDEAGAGSGDLVSTNNLSDLADAATARTNLGLGTAATVDTGTTIGTAVLWADDGSGNPSIPAGEVIDASGFDGNLATTDDTLAEVAQKVDDLVITGTDDQTAAEVPVTDTGANYTATDVEGVLAEIAPQLGGTDDQTAAEVAVTDSGGYFTGTDVEAVLQELGTAGATGNYVSAPTYSDSTGTAGQYATDGSYLYIATATDTWDRVALAAWSNPTPDYTPDGFGSVFLADTDVALSTLSTAGETYTVAGVTAGTAISVTGGEYQIDAAAWTSTSGTVSNGEVIGVRQTSSASNSTQTDAVVTIGTVSDTYSVTTVASGLTYLLQEDFEAGADGDQLVTLTGWGGTGSAYLTVDDAQAHAGTKSLLVTNTATATNTRAFTEQTTGKFTMAYWVRFDTSINQNQQLPRMLDASTDWIYSVLLSTDIRRLTGGSWVTHDTNLTVDTWHEIEIESDVDAGTYNVWVDNVQIITADAVANASATAPDTIRMSSSIATDTLMWIDDFVVYEGARQ